MYMCRVLSGIVSIHNVIAGAIVLTLCRYSFSPHYELMFILELIMSFSCSMATL